MKLWMRFGFACMIEEEEEEARQYHLALLHWKRLTIRTRNKLRCINLNNPEESTWHTLYASGLTESGRERIVNVTVPSLMIFTSSTSRHYSGLFRTGKRGRPYPRKLIDKSTVLGLILSFYVGIYLSPYVHRYDVPQYSIPDPLSSAVYSSRHFGTGCIRVV